MARGMYLNFLREAVKADSEDTMSDKIHTTIASPVSKVNREEGWQMPPVCARYMLPMKSYQAQHLSCNCTIHAALAYQL
jgi:hypothetical protein